MNIALNSASLLLQGKPTQSFHAQNQKQTKDNHFAVFSKLC